jgi:hypothetical protein
MFDISMGTEEKQLPFVCRHLKFSIDYHVALSVVLPLGQLTLET